jgi:hypothetical protein
VGAALSVVRDLAAGGHAALATPLLHAGTHAFVRGMSEGCLVAGGVAAAGAIAAAIWLPSHPPKEMVSAEDLVTPAAPAIASRAGHPLQHLTAVTETHGGGEPGKM